MTRSDVPSLDTDATAPASPADRQRRATERAETGRRVGRRGTTDADRSAIEYCVSNDLI